MISRKLFVFRGILINIAARYLKWHRIFGNVAVGRGVKIHRGAFVYCDNKSEIILGDNVILYSNTKIIAQGGEKISIGRNTSIQEHSHLEGNIEIDANCVIASRVYISTTTHTFNIKEGMLIKDQDSIKIPSAKKIIIGSNCWLGISAIILGQVIVKKNSVLGSGTLLSNYEAVKDSAIVHNSREVIETEIIYKT